MSSGSDRHAISAALLLVAAARPLQSCTSMDRVVAIVAIVAGQILSGCSDVLDGCSGEACAVHGVEPSVVASAGEGSMTIDGDRLSVSFATDEQRDCSAFITPRAPTSWLSVWCSDCESGTCRAVHTADFGGLPDLRTLAVGRHAITTQTVSFQHGEGAASCRAEDVEMSGEFVVTVVDAWDAPLSGDSSLGEVLKFSIAVDTDPAATSCGVVELALAADIEIEGKDTILGWAI